MKWPRRVSVPLATVVTLLGLASAPAAKGQGKKPNVLVIMGDDVGWFNIGAYHQGIMSGKTPNLDKLAAQGMRFTDYYAEASCTAGRANFIPIRTGMTTVGQAGSPIGLPPRPLPSLWRLSPWVTRLASLVRTTLAT
jgi:arylsulfatase A-like enzyme